MQDYIRRRHLRQFSSSEELFSEYYKKNKWSNPESVSGPGSTESYTENIRRELPLMFTRMQISRIFDAPCGDYNWFKMIDRSAGPEYIGGDIVNELINENERRYKDHSTTFVHFDITSDQFPDADVWLCRDCLFHLSEDMIFLAFKNFSRSNINYILTSTHPDAKFNSNITTGSFRLINLEKPPYSLPPPEYSMEDWIQPHPSRILALWSRQSVIDALDTRDKPQR